MRMKRWRDTTGAEERKRWSGEKANITRDERWTELQSRAKSVSQDG